MPIPSKTMGESQTFSEFCQSSATNRRKSGVLEEVFPPKMQTEASENHTVFDSYEKAEIRKEVSKGVCLCITYDFCLYTLWDIA